MCGFLEKKWLAQSRGALNLNKLLKVEVFCNYIYFCLTFSFFNDHFLASVTTNHKIASKSDFKQNYRSIKVRYWQNWCWGRGIMVTMNETEYLNTCEYGPQYMKMIHTMAPRTNFALTSPINIQLSYNYNKTGKQVSRLSLSLFSRKSIVTLVSLFMKN